MVKDLYKTEGAYGYFDRNPPVITIDSSQSREMQEITLLHEILHAVWPPDVVGDRTEERLITALDTELYAALKAAGVLK